MAHVDLRASRMFSIPSLSFEAMDRYTGDSTRRVHNLHSFAILEDVNNGKRLLNNQSHTMSLDNV